MRIVFKDPKGIQRAANISQETDTLVASILDERPTQATYVHLFEQLARKVTEYHKQGDEFEPLLTDVEIAALDSFCTALGPDYDLGFLEEAATSSAEAYAKLVPAAQKGLAFSARALRGMFRAMSQIDFEKQVARLVDAIPDDERVESMEFVEEVLTQLVQFVNQNTTEWDYTQNDYIDNHIYYQLFVSILRPSVESRGKSLCARRLQLLLTLVRANKF